MGMMGVGKSTIGSRLAEKLGRTFLDTDREVERLAGRSIAEIFAAEGEAHFRRLEAEAIDAASAAGSVIALGGGAVMAVGVIEKLLARGETVLLIADPELLVERIGDPSSRPLLAGLDREGRLRALGRLLEERRSVYERAKVQVDADGGPDEVVLRILAAMGLA